MATNPRKLIETYIDLLKLLECPVCYEYGSSDSPIKLCREGHLICGVCAPNVPFCPTCKSGYSDTRARILDQITEALIYPCNKVGCGMMLPLKDLRSHEEECACVEENHSQFEKDVILTHNVLKHIEDNYASFYVTSQDNITECCSNCLGIGLLEETGEEDNSNNEQNIQHPGKLELTEELNNRIGCGSSSVNMEQIILFPHELKSGYAGQTNSQFLLPQNKCNYTSLNMRPEDNIFLKGLEKKVKKGQKSNNSARRNVIHPLLNNRGSQFKKIDKEIQCNLICTIHQCTLPGCTDGKESAIDTVDSKSFLPFSLSEFEIEKGGENLNLNLLFDEE